MSFDQERYWIDRHRQHAGDPRSVGTFARSVEENLIGEGQLKRVVAEAARLLKPARSVLDLGCGYGRVAKSYLDEGYQYTGVDISPEAIAAAKNKCPAGEFICAALGDWAPERSFDVVCALYLFVHFVEDEKWRDLVEKALGCVSDDGAVLFADEFPDQRTKYGEHAIGRPLAEYGRIFEAAGFSLDRRFPEQLAARALGLSAVRNFQLARKKRG